MRRWAVVLCLLGLGTVNALGAGLPDAWVRAACDPGSRTTLTRAIATERLRGGYGDITPLASALLKASRSQPLPDVAENLAALAAEAAPGDPRAHVRLARLALTDLRHPALGVWELLSALGAAVSDPWVQASLAARLGAMIWLGAVASALAILVLGVSVYGPSCFHDYADAFPEGMRRCLPWALGALMFAVLASSDVGPLTVAALLSLVLLFYIPARGRWALAGCVILSTLVFPLTSGLSTLGLSHGQRAWALYRVERGGSSAELDEDLARLFANGERRGLVARGYVARRAGRLGAAARFLETAAESGDDNGFARLELGNVLFLEGLLDAAAAQYEEVARQRPKDPLPWINLHVLDLKRLELVRADRDLAVARSLDPQAVEAFHELPGGADALLPLSQPLPSSWVRLEFFSGLGPQSSWVRALSQALILPARWMQPLYLSLAVLLAALVAGRRREGVRSYRCSSCGGIVCPRCSRRVKGSSLCAACWALLRQKATDGAARERQASSARRWQGVCARWRRAADALVPGWPGFFFEGSIRDLGLGVLWSLAVGALALDALYPISPLPWLRGAPTVAFALLLLGVYASAAHRAPGGKSGERRR